MIAEPMLDVNALNAALFKVDLGVDTNVTHWA